VYNLGTGKPASVLDLIHTFEKVSGKKVAHVLEGRREGDIVAMYANPTLTTKELGWSSKFDLLSMCNTHSILA
jgi:UDP-glucose 4-epimerase